MAMGDQVLVVKELRTRGTLRGGASVVEGGAMGSSKVKAIRVNSKLYDGEETASESDSESYDGEDIASDCFMNLSELRYFEAEYSELIGDFSNLLPNMRWLRLPCHHQNAGDKLTNLKMKNLIILDLLSSKVEDDWGGWSHVKMANKLKVLNLFYCSELTRLPCFPISGSLEILNLSGLSLRSADLDIGNLRNLKVLLLEDTTGIRKITGGTIGVLKQLRELDVTGFSCENLGEALADIGEQQALKHLRASGADIVAAQGTTQVGIKLPASLKELITSSPVPNLSELLDLETLEVRNCDYGLEIPPEDTMWWNLSKLKSLKLIRTKIVATISPRPSMLLPSSLTRLIITLCNELEWLPNLENLENLTELSMSFSQQLQEIQGLGGLKSLQVLKIERGETLRNLNGLDSLMAMKKLEISSCYALRRLPSLAFLSNLCEFNVLGCRALAEIQGLGGLESLQMLEIKWSERLTLLEGLGTLLSFNKLQTLYIDCPRLTTLSSRDHQQLGGGGGGASQLVLDSLQKLSIHGSALLLKTSFGGQMLHLSKFPRLMELQIWQTGYTDVEKELLLEGLESLEELTKLWLLGSAIQKLPSLSKLHKLVELEVIDASNLREIEGVADLKSLQVLTLRGCTSFERLPEGLSGLERLRKLDIRRCTNLTDLSALSHLPSNVISIWHDGYYR